MKATTRMILSDGLNNVDLTAGGASSAQRTLAGEGICTLPRDVEIVNPLQSEILSVTEFNSGDTPLVSTTYVATSRDWILRCWELEVTPDQLWLVQMLLPVVWNPPSRTRRWLAERMVLRWGHWESLARPIRPIVIEPILAGFKAADDPMFLCVGVSGRMLVGRRVATTDVSTGGAAAKVEPPALDFCALDAAVTTWRSILVNQYVSHPRHHTLDQFLGAVERAAVRLVRRECSMPGSKVTSDFVTCSPSRCCLRQPSGDPVTKRAGRIDAPPRRLTISTSRGNVQMPSPARVR
jgi:hypothetical protein